MGKRKTVNSLYRIARLARDIEVLASGRPDKIMKRYVNKYLLKKWLSKLLLK